MKIFDLFKKKAVEVNEPVILNDIIKQDMFTCHYCQHQFETTPKMIVPVSVQVLYQNYFIQGKGIQCPQCKKTCIFG